MTELHLRADSVLNFTDYARTQRARCIACKASVNQGAPVYIGVVDGKHRRVLHEGCGMLTAPDGRTYLDNLEDEAKAYAEKMAFDKNAQPTGAELRAFRLRIIVNGQPCTQQRFADSIDTALQNIKNYEAEKNGTLMPAHLWLIVRITWDALALEQWKKTRPKRDEQ